MLWPLVLNCKLIAGSLILLHCLLSLVAQNVLHGKDKELSDANHAAPHAQAQEATQVG